MTTDSIGHFRTRRQSIRRSGIAPTAESMGEIGPRIPNLPRRRVFCSVVAQRFPMLGWRAGRSRCRYWGKKPGVMPVFHGVVGKSVLPCLSLTLLVLGTAGCAHEKPMRIAQLEPYVGPRPTGIRQLPAPVYHPPRHGPGKSHHRWIPPNGISDRWECIVIHHSATRDSSPQSMRAYHVNERGWDALGYHFVIGNGVSYGDGAIYVGERWRKQMTGAHCKVPGNHYNEHGIGICLIGNFETQRPTTKQIESLAELVGFLSRKCGISRSRILTHGGVTHKTACPGRHFSLDTVLRRISGGRLSAASN